MELHQFHPVTKFRIKSTDTCTNNVDLDKLSAGTVTAKLVEDINNLKNYFIIFLLGLQQFNQRWKNVRFTKIGGSTFI